jgi:hypothetical protein
LKAPATGQYAFKANFDNGADLIIGGSTLIKMKDLTKSITDMNVYKNLEKDKLYKLILRWGESTEYAKVTLLYSYPGKAFSIIPSSQFYYQEFVGSSPHTITISCHGEYDSVKNE